MAGSLVGMAVGDALAGGEEAGELGRFGEPTGLALSFAQAISQDPHLTREHYGEAFEEWAKARDHDFPIPDHSEPGIDLAGALSCIAPVVLHREPDGESAVGAAQRVVREELVIEDGEKAVALFASTLIRMVRRQSLEDIPLSDDTAFPPLAASAIAAFDTAGSFEEALEHPWFQSLPRRDAATHIAGALLGTLAGARCGFSRLPDRWLSQLPERDRVVSLAEELIRDPRTFTYSRRESIVRRSLELVAQEGGREAAFHAAFPEGPPKARPDGPLMGYAMQQYAWDVLSF